MKFSIEAILTVLGSKLICEIGDFYKILNYMTGDNLFTHQLQRASRACAPELQKQLPWTKDISTESVTPQNVEDFSRRARATFGAEFEVKPLPPGTWESRDPISELCEMRKEGVVIVKR